MKTTVWSPRQLERLRGSLTTAMSRIEGRVHEAHFNTNGCVRWGQFLDGQRVHSQYGVYGTAAAVEILRMAGTKPDNPMIADALECLPIIGTGKGYEDRRDEHVTFKVAAIVDAAASGSTQRLSMSHPAVAELLSMQADERGWAEQAGPAPDRIASVAATSAAMFSLREIDGWSGSDRCRLVLEWIVAQTQDASLDANEVALALLALVSYEGPGIGIAGWAEGVTTLADRVRAEIRQAKSIQIVPMHFGVRITPRHENKYMFYSPELVGALALLRASALSAPIRAREAVSVVERCVEILQHGSVSADGRWATLDHLWMYRLLSEFRAALSSRMGLLLPAFADFLARRRMKWVAILVALVLATIGGRLGVDTDLGIWVQVGGWVLLTVAGGAAIALVGAGSARGGR